MRASWRLISSVVAGCAFGFTAGVHAQTVHLCVRDGQRVYSDRPCDKTDQSASLYTIHTSAPQPPAAAVLQLTERNARERGAMPGTYANPTPSPYTNVAPTSNGPGSFRCAAGNGEVFYQNQACPQAITTGPPLPYATTDSYGNVLRAGVARQESPVTQQVVDRATACREVARSDFSGRNGRKRDGLAADPYTREIHPEQDACHGY